MTTSKYWRAVNTALSDAMAADPRVLVLGQDVGRPGGPFGTTRGLLDAFGPERVRDTPISEAAQAACGVGAAMMGLRPVVDIMFADFLTLAADQIVNQAAKQQFLLGDGAELPIVFMTLSGARASMGAQHSQSLEAWMCHIPGLKVAFPSTPQDAYDVLRQAVADPGPVLVINAIELLGSTGSLESGAPRVSPHDVGRARIVRAGDEVTVVTYGTTVPIAEAAVEEVSADVELIDLRWLAPWDAGLVVESVRRTSRLVVVHEAVGPHGLGAEVVAQVTHDSFWYLDAPPTRVAGAFTPLPVQSADWSQLLPSVASVRAAIDAVLESSP